MLRPIPTRQRELGGYLFESFFHSFLLLFLLLLTVFVFIGGLNTMIAASAANETAIYAAGSGAWTGRSAERCIDHLPGPVRFRSCRLFRQDPADPTKTLGGALPELCSGVDYNAAEGLAMNKRQGAVADCLNDPATTPGRFRPAGAVDLHGKAQPLRLEIRYRQWYINLCPFLPQAGDIQHHNDCQTRSSHVVVRNIVFYSQTVREQ
jgi:hypothetical protein